MPLFAADFALLAGLLAPEKGALGNFWHRFRLRQCVQRQAGIMQTYDHSNSVAGAA